MPALGLYWKVTSACNRPKMSGALYTEVSFASGNSAGQVFEVSGRLPSMC